MTRILGVVMTVLPLAALAADEPEAVYAKLHRATLAGNVDEVLAYASAERRKEIASLPGKEDMVRMVAMTLPESYSITRKTVRGGKAHLSAQGVHESGPARGEVDLVREKGAWKVDEWTWSSLAQVKPMAVQAKPSRVQAASPGMAAKGASPAKAPEAPAAPAPAASEAPAANASGMAQPVEPIPAVPVEAPTLRRATADDIGCIIKPVMTDDELRRCGATPPKYD